MRILWSWLQELVEITESPEAVADKLTRAGIEVEGIFSYRRLPSALDRIWVGEVTRCERHPAADRLTVCEVRIAPEKSVVIVTGASNIDVGAKVPVALPGAEVKIDGRWIPLQARSLRGILSEGMLCSESELGIGSDSEGIFLLAPEAPVGRRLSEVLEDYTDTILEISPTPNRGDALSHWGIAREYHVLTGARLHRPTHRIEGERKPLPLQIRVPNEVACPRYGGVYISGLVEKPVSPGWLRHRLEAAGLRSIHPIVDVTNYLLIGWGQPLHAFDVEQLEGSTLHVAPLEEPALFESISGQKLQLQPGDIVISDGKGPACLAGLIGGSRTAVTGYTHTVFIESAYFSPTSIRRTGRRLGLHTESGYRFMRGTDPRQVPWAAEAAASLLQRIYPTAEVSMYGEHHSESHTADRRFPVQIERIRQVTGLPLSSSILQERLERLEITVTPLSAEEWEVSVPRYRLDVTRPADIAEELLRLEGWDKVPRMRSQAAVPYLLPTRVDFQYQLQQAISEFLTGMGLWEIRTNSLVGPHHFPPELPFLPIRLANPLYEELAYLRPTLIGSGLEVLSHNRNHGSQGFWGYEWGKVYTPEGEQQHLALWGWGRPPYTSLEKDSSPLAHFSALVRALLQRLSVPYREKPFSSPQGLWREGVQLYLQETFLGVVGLLSDIYLERFGLQGEQVACAEILPLFWENNARHLPHFRGISYQPVVIKDLSIYLTEGLSYADILQSLRDLNDPYLFYIEPFDFYIDAEGKRSYGIRLYLQGDHTLSEGEIHAFLRKAIAAVEGKGAIVRKSNTV